MSKLSKSEIADIEQARTDAAKAHTRLESASSNVARLRSELATAERDLATALTAKHAAAQNLCATALWTVPGVPTENDVIPSKVFAAMSKARHFGNGINAGKVA